MGLFSRKPKVGVEEFCRNFYDSQIFNPMKIGGIDVVKDWWQTAFNSLVQADDSCKLIDFSKFQEEMTALQVELFGLVFLNRYKSEQLAILQRLFTKRYLEEMERPLIWEAMNDYNQELASSATLNEYGRQMNGRVGRAKITGINLSRANMFDKWIEVYVSDKGNPTDEDNERMWCIARVAGHKGVDIKRADCIAIKLLASKLAERLGGDENLNSEVLFILSPYIYGLHEGVKEALRDVNIQM